MSQQPAQALTKAPKASGHTEWLKPLSEFTSVLLPASGWT